MVINKKFWTIFSLGVPEFCQLRLLFFFRPLSSVHLFQSNQHFQSIEFVDQHVWKSSKLISPTLSSQNMRDFDHATILSPSFHGLRKGRLAQWPPFAYKIRRKTQVGYIQKNWVGCAARFLKPLPYFPTLFHTWSIIWYPLSDLKPWPPARDRSAWQAVTARTRLA